MEMKKWIYLVSFLSAPGRSTLHYSHNKTWRTSKKRETDRGYDNWEFWYEPERMDLVRWSSMSVAMQHFGEEEFRKAFKASSDNILFQKQALGTEKFSRVFKEDCWNLLRFVWFWGCCNWRVRRWRVHETCQ